MHVHAGQAEVSRPAAVLGSERRACKHDRSISSRATDRSSRRAAARASAPLRIRGGGTKDFYGGELRGEVLDTRAYCGHRRLRADRARDHRARGHAARGDRSRAARARPDARVRAAALRRRRDARRLHRRGAVGAAPAVRRQRARPRARRAHARRQRHRPALRRPGHEERRRLRRVAADGRARSARSACCSRSRSRCCRCRPPRSRCAASSTQAHAIELMNAWAGKPLPITATCHVERRALRADSPARSRRCAPRAQKLGGEEVADGARFWAAVRDQRTRSSQAPRRCGACRSNRPRRPSGLGGRSSSNGAARCAGSPATSSLRAAREAAARAGGHATLFRGGDKAAGVFHPLPAPLLDASRAPEADFRSARDTRTPAACIPDF